MEKPIQTAKAELCLCGWMAPFWKSHYWFNDEDGLFVKFEGRDDVVNNTQVSIVYDG
jgi:hypothetical protein